MTARIVMAALAAALGVAAPAAAASPAVHAHRGGPVTLGEPAFPENTMPAFRHAATQGWVLELDVKLTKDRVPIVIHDATLDRTTPCTGLVRDRTFADIRSDCPSDVVGTPGAATSGFGRQMTGAEEPVPVPALAEVLALARDRGARLNLEIKNLPTDADFDPTPRFAETVAGALAAADLDPGDVIVQSFWPPNLDVSELRLPLVATSLLTLSAMNDGAPAYAAARRYEWVSPQWPASAAALASAGALGRRVVPFTLDTPDAVVAAATAGVDAVITNDPLMATRALDGAAS